MRFGILAGVSAIGCLSLLGCGDDEDGTGGSGTTAETTTSISSSTGMMLSPIGSACTVNDTCEGGLCLVQGYALGWAGGYCSAFCDPVLAPCAEGECLNGPDFPLCVKTCDPADATTCNGLGQSCQDLSGMGDNFCFGGCKTTADCGAGYTCDTSQVMSGACVPNEVCTGGTDEDGDGVADCEDPDCATDTGCLTAVADACSGATALTLNMPAAGTLSGTTSNFVSHCGGNGAPEKLYSLTASSDGFLVVTLDSATADLGVSVRTTCTDGTTEKSCADSVAGMNATEQLVTSVKNGDALTLIVDGYAAGRVGDFTVNATVAPQQDESEDNGSILTADAVTIANGVAILGASINPTADEDWYTFTLAAPANITISTGDFGMSKCGLDIDTNMELTDVTGLTVIDTNDDISPFGNYCSTMSETALAAGTYHVHVLKSDLASATLTYEYSLQIFTN